MGFVFVRQNGKVFGPFADDRLQAAMGTGKFDASAEFASNWDGPWGPLSNLQSVRVAAQPGPIPAPTNRPPVQSPHRHASSQPPQIEFADGEEEATFPHFFHITGAANETIGIESASQDLDGADDDDATFFGSLTAAAHRSSVPEKDRLTLSIPLAIAAGGGVLAAGVVLIAAIMIFGGGQRPPATPQANESESAIAARNDQTAPGIAPRKRLVAPTRQPAAGEGPSVPTAESAAPSSTARHSGTSQQAATALPRDTRSLDATPDEAEEAVKSLRSLRASIDIGISFEQYTAKLQSLLPPVKLFLESRDAQRVPQLAAMLTNASDCYVAVKRIWNDSIFDSSPTAKAEAAALLAATRTRLWEIADTNVQIAYDLTSPEPDVRSRALERAAADSESLRPDPVIDAARRAFADRRPVPSAHAASRPASAPKSTFNSENIDVRALRNLAETLKQGELAGEDLELVDQVLTLTRPREWQTRQGDKSWGDAITIRPDTVRLITKKGDGTIPRARLSEAGQKVLGRIVDLAEKLHSLSNRPAAEAPTPAP